MENKIIKIEETINQLISSIEYLNEHITDVESISHSILPIQRKIKELNQQIQLEKGQSQQNKPLINDLCKQEYELQERLNTVSSIESRLPNVMELISSFLRKHNYKIERLNELSEKELLVVDNLYKISIPSTLSRGRTVLQSYLKEVSNDVLIQLMNSKFRLRGYKRFYLDEGKIASKYCEDLRAIMNEVLDNNNNSFRGLINIIKAKYPDKTKYIRPIDVLRAIISHYNKRQV